MEIIAHIRTDFPTKFGIPRQSGLVSTLRGSIVFTPPYRNADALRGLEGFSHLWLIWDFSEAHREGWSPTVRPPRLGGNVRLGVFATRSPFRPNPIGLSCVKIEGIELHTPEGPIVHVSGADMLDGTPLFDIKPYLAVSDAHPEARCGFAEETAAQPPLTVSIPDALLQTLAPDRQQALQQILAADPRPRYHADPQRIYAFEFAGAHIRFRVDDETHCLSVLSETEQD